MINALLRDPDDAVLAPIPQYPLYSAAIQMFGGFGSWGWGVGVGVDQAGAGRHTEPLARHFWFE
jgi:hypothetical protein